LTFFASEAMTFERKARILWYNHAILCSMLSTLQFDVVLAIVLGRKGSRPVAGHGRTNAKTLHCR
jgi:hypothetical protein